MKVSQEALPTHISIESKLQNEKVYVNGPQDSLKLTV